MTLTDTGPLVALINRKDGDHARCVAALETLRGPFHTTWPCFAETMHLVGKSGGVPAQTELWEYVSDGTLTFHDLSAAEIAQMPILMEKYRDTPMDLADASLVVSAQTLGVSRVFTLDSDFFVYRLENGVALEVVP